MTATRPRTQRNVRQEVLNVLIAQLLEQRGLVAVPESIIPATGRQRRRMPDVLVDFRGLRLAIEGEFAAAQAMKKARDSAADRVTTGIAHVGVALIYPRELKSAPADISSLRDSLGNAELHYAIVTELEADQLLLPFAAPDTTKVPFETGTVDSLAAAVRRSYDYLVKDEVLQRAVDLLEHGITLFVGSLATQPATTDRFMDALGIQALPPARRKSSQRLAIERIAALVLLNAMIFQEVLAQTHPKVRPLNPVINASDPTRALSGHWDFILRHVNYFPIFHIAHQLLQCLSADASVIKAVSDLSGIARQVVGWRASLRHDLAGRIYHQLLTDAKYLGAYYTSIPAAALLATLALSDEATPSDWSDLEVLQRFKIADFACGTGTLLMAAADAITDNHIRSAVRNDVRLDLDRLQDVLVHDVIHGFDVLHAALHLTASTLALRVPDVPINVTHLFRVPFGDKQGELGSLEFFRSAAIGGTDLFAAAADYVTGTGTQTTSATTALVPDLDLCIMNPPFTSSRQPNLLFGSVPDGQRAELQKRLKKLVRDFDLPVSITAGLAAVFTVLGDRYLKPGGRLALVTQRTALSGIAWRRTRELLGRGYDLEYVVTSHEPDHWNFSDTTELSEVLIVARKRVAGERGPAGKYVNLWHNPRNAVEALTLQRLIAAGKPAPIAVGSGVASLTVGSLKYGEMLAVPSGLGVDDWSAPCAFAQTELVRCLFRLFGGELVLPGDAGVTRLPLAPLGELGSLGPDPRDVYDGFRITESRTPYAALWGGKNVGCLAQTPNMHLEPLNSPRERRKVLRKAEDLWPKAARVLLTMRTWLPTKALAAVRLSRRVLSDIWWPLVLTDGHDRERREKALVVWLNSTPALILLLGRREETRGPWIQFKKPTVRDLPVLDVRALDDGSVGKLSIVFDSVAKSVVRPFPEMADDPVRAKIDAAVSDTLGLPPLDELREALSCEPIFSLSMSGLTRGPSADGS